MKRLFLIFSCSIASISFSQQSSLTTQYMFNEVAVNPGAVGTKDYIPIHLSGRLQWLGFKGSPATQSLTSHADLGSNFGFGGTIYNEVTGPSRRTGINLMGAYQLRLSKDKKHRLGLGLGVSLEQHVVDGNKLNTYLPDDPAVARAYNNRFVPDANFGIYYTYGKKGYFGISVQNVINSKRELFDVERKLLNPIVRSYQLIGGYNFSLSDKWKMSPSVMFRMIDALAYQVDGTLLITYNDLVWLGGGYRHGDAASILFGFNVKMFKMGYSYDFTLSEIKKYSSGTHELFLELQIFKSKKNSNSSRVPWSKRNRVYSPGN